MNSNLPIIYSKILANSREIIIAKVELLFKTQEEKYIFVFFNLHKGIVKDEKNSKKIKDLNKLTHLSIDLKNLTFIEKYIRLVNNKLP